MTPKMPKRSEDTVSQSRKPMSLLLKVSLWTAVVLHILGLLLFRLGANYLTEHKAVETQITFVSDSSFANDAELEEYAVLFDFAPLFIPTHWNASQLVEVDFENTSIGQFSEFEPVIGLFNELEPEGLLKTDNYRIEQPVDLLNSRFWRFFDDFGRSAEEIMPFEATRPVAEVSVIDKFQNSPIALTVNLEPTTSFSIAHPVSYAIRRSNDGLIWSVPTLIETSGNEAFDQAVAQWLQRPEVLAQLPIGYLMIRVFFW